MRKIEIRFREKNQRVEWEDLPIILYSHSDDLEARIKWVKRMFQCVEIRWNYYFSYQGHYIDGNVLRY